MIPYVVPLGVLLALAVARLAPAVARRYALVDAAAWSLSAMLVMTGIAHFVGLRDDMIRMVPPVFPRPDLIVTMTGVLELTGAVALIPKRTRAATGVALALLFVAMLPANIYAARAGLTFGGEPATPLVVRVPEQLIYITLALAPIVSAKRSAVRPNKRTATASA